MSKPKTQSEIDAWNSGARQADATWWQASWERGAGIEYERVDGRSVRTAGGGVSVVAEQQESKRGI